MGCRSPSYSSTGAYKFPDDCLLFHFNFNLPAHWYKLQTFNRVALRIWHGISKFSDNGVSPVEAEYSLFLLQVGARALAHTERLHRTPSASYLLLRFLGLPRPHIGRLGTKFGYLIGPPSLLLQNGPLVLPGFLYFPENLS